MGMIFMPFFTGGNLMQKTSLIKRALTYIIDLYLATLLSTLPISLASYYMFHQISQDLTRFSLPISYLLLFLSIFAFIIYFIIIPYYTKGQTLGKKLMHQTIHFSSFSSLWIRQSLYMLCLTSLSSLIVQIIQLISTINIITYIQPIIFTLSFITILQIIFNKNHIAWYDILAKTQIIERSQANE